MRNAPSKALRLGLALLAALAAHSAQASAIVQGCDHVTDGLFNHSDISTSDATEWGGCGTVSKSFFAPAADGSGGAYLYADQSGPNLALMYDYTSGDAAAFTPSSFFDVFFEVVPDGHAYLVRIPVAGQLEAFERPIGSVAPLVNGSFAIGPGSGWEPLDQFDLDLAQFQGAVGFGTSENSSVRHPMAEFQLTINQPGPGGHPGIYDPDPAFWSASAKPGGAADPPISSGVFQLLPNGTTVVVPVLGPNGGPVMQGSVLPEPATLLLFASGFAGMLAARRARRG
jgi:hypothetical protein